MTSKEGVSRAEIVVTGQELVDIFNSQEFRDEVFNLAGRIVEVELDEIFEMGLYYMRHLEEPKYKVVKDEKVDFRSIGPGVRSGAKLDRLLESNYFPLINIHFHTPQYLSDIYSEGAYWINDRDLETNHWNRKEIRFELGYDYAQLFVVSLAMGDNISMTLLQETSLCSFSSDTFKQYYEDAYACLSEKEMLGLLRGYGYRAEQIVLNRDGLSEEDQEILKSFEVVLKPIDKEKERKEFFKKWSKELNASE